MSFVLHLLHQIYHILHDLLYIFPPRTCLSDFQKEQSELHFSSRVTCETSYPKLSRLLAGTDRRPSAVGISVLHYLCINSKCVMWPDAVTPDADKLPAAAD